MRPLPTIEAYADLVLTGEDPTKVAVAGANGEFKSDVMPPTPTAIPFKRPHFLTYEEQIEGQVVAPENVVLRDE